MRPVGVARVALLGALGFGIGGAIASAGFLIPVGGAVAGASLGLALGDWRKVATLALLGVLGTTLGVLAALVVTAPLSYPSWAMAAVIGAVIGASLGLAFLNWKTVAALALVGGVGFGIGGAIAGDSPAWLLAVGALGGASLGTTLGYLEYRTRPENGRPRVR